MLNAYRTCALPEALTDKPLRIGSHTLRSRLIVGTGKYATFELMQQSLDLSGTDCITVAVRRERLFDGRGKNLLDFLDLEPLHDPAQHRRLLQRGRRGPRRPAGPRDSRSAWRTPAPTG